MSTAAAGRPPSTACSTWHPTGRISGRVYGATAALTGLYIVSTVVRPAGSTSPLWDGWVANLGYGGCAVVCGWRAVTVRRERGPWAMIALSLALFTAGNIAWTTAVQFLDPPPYPSIADIFFLVFYPIAFIGVGLLIRESVVDDSVAIVLDALVAALGVVALGAVFVIGPISAVTTGDAATVATTLAYPMGDLVMVAMLTAVFTLRRWSPGRRWWTLAAGLVIFVMADSIFVLRVNVGTYVTGTFLDSVWLIGTFVIATAAWQPDPAGPRQRQEAPITVPAFFSLSSLAILVYGAHRTVIPLAEVLATATLVVAIVRMFLAYHQLRILAETTRQAGTDELTGLANRRRFYELLHQHLDARPAGGVLAVLMVDLDRFKEINDSLGHHVGDDILRALGPRLVEVADDASVVARLGGDEFGVLLSSVDDPAAAAVLAERMCEVVRQPFQLGGMSLHVDASVGIALAPDHGASADVLLQRADVAMYEAKHAHRGWELYSAEHDVHTPERLELMSELRDAIARGELVPHYQPKLDLRTGCLRGVEALVRWHHPVLGVLTPDRFLDLVEESGLIGPLTMTVLDQALDQRAQWAGGGVELTVAVNLSTTNLRDDTLPEKVHSLLARYGVPGRSLILEITEESLITDVGPVRGVLAGLRALGVELSVDDFGTGFSSLAYLRDLPVNELKLDRAFLADAADDVRTVSIIRSTVELAHTLDLRIVAEGVETEAGLALIARLGCDVAQGYFLGRPMPADDVVGACSSNHFDVPVAVEERRSRLRSPALRSISRGRRRMAERGGFRVDGRMARRAA